MKTLYLHIGLQKTGTSTVQMHFMHPKGAFQIAGIDFLPQAIAPNQAHHNAAWDVGEHKRFRSDLPGFSDLVSAARASTSDRIFVSSEDFSLVSTAQVLEAANAFTDFDVRPILCLRNQLSWSESFFAQACKRGYVKPFGTFIKTLTKGGRTDFEAIYSAWATVFGHDKMHVLIYEDNTDIIDAFADLMGVPVEDRPFRKNRSLNERFVKASQIVAERCKRGMLTHNGQTLPKEALNDVFKIMLAAGSHHPQFFGTPVFLKRDKAQEYLSRFAEMNKKIAQHVTLPDSYFTVPENRRNPRKHYDLDVEFLIECIFEDSRIQGHLTSRVI